MTFPFIKNKDQSDNCPGAKVSKMDVNIRSHWIHFENLEALIYCLESPFHFIRLSETRLKMNEDSSIFLAKSYKEFKSKARDYRWGGVVIQTLEGCSIAKDNSIALDDAMSANLTEGCLRLNLTFTFIKPRNSRCSSLKI